MYTPLKVNPDTPKLNYPPLLCSRTGCRAVLNCFCQVDYNSKIWMCNFCGQRNGFPKEYSGINESYQPAELMQHNTTKQLSGPLILLLVVDTCMEPQELQVLKTSIKEVVSQLPPHTLIGLISFGQHAKLHEIHQTSVSTSYCFRGSKKVEGDLVKKVLSYGVPRSQAHAAPVHPSQHDLIPKDGSIKIDPNNRFLQPLSTCESEFMKLLTDLRIDSWPVTQGKRAVRCTGAALSLAVTFLEQTYPTYGARIMLFTGGPCTVGPGQVVDPDLKHIIRSHHDILNDNAPFLKKSHQFFKELSNTAATNGHCIDILSCCLDQTGLLEMRDCFRRTGGYLVMADSFNTTIFQHSLKKIFEKNEENQLNFMLSSYLELKVSKDLEICGCIGHCYKQEPKDDNISSKQIGVGKTNYWKICSLDKKATYAFVFELSKSSMTTQNIFFQFTTLYQHSSPDRVRMRVTTCSRPVSNDPSSSLSVAHSFDQDAAAVLMARIASDRLSINDNPGDVMRWLDRTLIHLCQYVAQFQKDDTRSFRLADNFALYPQYMFHLRRSQFLQCFNNSPDETVFYRYALDREDVLNSCVMIQPVLYSYSLDAPPKPVLLDSSSIKPDLMLFLDSYFFVLIYLGETISYWRKQGYQNDPNYASFAQFLEGPIYEAQEIIRERMPVPRYIYTGHEDSQVTLSDEQARFLLSKVNPSQTHNNSVEWQNNEMTVLTDDISLQAFIDHLKKLVVTQT
ncbi:Protein transport protein Sec23A [Thelohanellus kitauei]|uniref:Protein transport protein SEC23 n=1 Tax=Thelohanellus kitauei TaxID=669202 RepID=A0A0C2MJR1_THEKT|nr:Protein transport protein Sec23A [Thelohanellus kitauei]